MDQSIIYIMNESQNDFDVKTASEIIKAEQWHIWYWLEFDIWWEEMWGGGLMFDNQPRPAVFMIFFVMICWESAQPGVCCIKCFDSDF